MKKGSQVVEHVKIDPSLQIRSIEVNNNKMLDTFFAKLYSKTIFTPVKEYISNAIDATIEAKNALESITIQTPSVASPVLVVRDFGNGMSEEFFNRVFLRAGESTAENDENKNGYYGIGSKSWFATGNDEFFYDVFFNGTKFSYMLFRKNGEYKNLKQGEFPTKEPNGLQVRLPCKKEQIEEVKNAVYHNLFYVKNKIKVDGKEAPNYMDTLVYENDEIIIHEEQKNHRNDGLMVVIGYFSYKIPKVKDADLIKDEENYHQVLVYKKQIGGLAIAPNRENIIEDEKFKVFKNSLNMIIRENQKNIDANVSAYYERKIFGAIK